MSGDYLKNKKGESIHRLVAEKYLRRKLLPGEVVHHIDENKKHNVIWNLIVFESTGAHLAYHKKKTWDTFYGARVGRIKGREQAERYYCKTFGIVLYGPFFKAQAERDRKKIIEKTKHDLGIV